MSLQIPIKIFRNKKSQSLKLGFTDPPLTHSVSEQALPRARNPFLSILRSVNVELSPSRFQAHLGEVFDLKERDIEEKWLKRLSACFHFSVVPDYGQMWS